MKVERTRWSNSGTKGTRTVIHQRYLRWLLGATAAWFGFFFALTWIIDPYGVSPIRVSIPRFNTYKVARIDIDRLTKPYEVWRQQPRTVFLGSSRIHESMDPAALNGTRYAPAYNAAIPADSLGESFANLKLFIQLDPNLRAVFLELFLYKFIIPQPTVERSFGEFLRNTASLHFSTDTLRASAMTVGVNALRPDLTAYVSAGGHWVPPAGYSTLTNFDQSHFIKSILGHHQKITDMVLQSTAIASLDRIVALCRERGIELHMIVTPSYPWDDYRLLSLGYWPLLEQWLRQLSRYENVVSFSQYNDVLTEPPGAQMRWWYDPIHFSGNTGMLMLAALSGQRASGTPNNFLTPITPQTVEAVIRDRRAGLASWVQTNADYVAAFERGKREAGGPVDHR